MKWIVIIYDWEPQISTFNSEDEALALYREYEDGRRGKFVMIAHVVKSTCKDDALQGLGK